MYFAWTASGGRLSNIKAGLAASPNSLMDLAYSYDAGGKVRTIADAKAGGIQTKTYIYDSLGRIVTGVSSGGTGGTYSQGPFTHNAIGNLTSTPALGTYTYAASASGCAAGTPAIKPHAVSAAGADRYAYDCNGNVTTRTAGGSDTLSYNAENQLTAVSGAPTASFVYDGNRVKATVGGVTTAYIGNYYEWIGSATTAIRYYYAGSQRAAEYRAAHIGYNPVA